jgi:hypothetical protein
MKVIFTFDQTVSNLILDTASGSETLPTFSAGSSGSSVSEAIRIDDGGSTRFVPFVDPADAAIDGIRLDGGNAGTKAVHDSASLVSIPGSAVHRFKFSDPAQTQVSDAIGSETLTLSSADYDSDNWQEGVAFDAQTATGNVGGRIAEVNKSSSFSVGFSIEKDDTSTTQNIIEQSDSASTGFVVNVNSGKVGVRTHDDSTRAAPYSANTKTRVVVTCSNGSNPSIFLNKSQFNQSVNVSNNSSGTDFRIGTANANSSAFDGKIDDLIIYNKVLTQNEINADYNIQPWT